MSTVADTEIKVFLKQRPNTISLCPNNSTTRSS